MKTRLKRICSLILAWITLLTCPLLGACRFLPSARENEMLTYGEWLSFLCDSFSMTATEREPLIAGVTQTDPYFEEVQACAERDVLLPGEHIHTDRPLACGDVAVTLVRLLHITSDRDGSSLLVAPRWYPYRAELAAAVDAKLLPMRFGLLACSARVSLRDAEDTVSKAVEQWMQVEERNELILAPDVTDLRGQGSDALDAAYTAREADAAGDTYQLRLPADAGTFSDGGVYLFEDAAGQPCSLKVLSAKTAGDEWILTCTDPQIDEVLTEADYAHEADRDDFSAASFVTPDGTVIPLEDVAKTSRGFSLVPTAHAGAGSGAFKISGDGMDVEIKLESNPSKGDIAVEFSGSIPEDGTRKLKLSGKVKLSDFRTATSFHLDGASLDKAELELSYQQELSFSLEEKDEKELPWNLLKPSQKKLHLKLGEIRWAVFYIEIGLDFDVKGKITYSVTTVHQNCMEYSRENGFLYYKSARDLRKSVSASVSVELYAVLDFGVALLKWKIINLTGEIGAGAKAETKLNFMQGDDLIYQLDGEKAEAFTEEELEQYEAAEVPDVIYCTDISVYPIAKIKFASDESLLGRVLGAVEIKLEWDILPREEHSTGLLHYENFKEVPKCTVSSIVHRPAEEEKSEPAPTPTPTPAPDYSHLVEDAVSYVKDIPQAVGNPVELDFHVPRIVLEGDAIDTLNRKIMDTVYTDEVKRDIRMVETEGAWPFVLSITYDWYVRNDILTIVVCTDCDAGWVEYNTYCVDLNTGSELSADEILASCGMSRADYNAKLKAVLDRRINKPELAEWYASEQETYNYIYSSTLSAENMAKAVPFRNESGGISVSVPVYAIAGADWYWEIIEL